MAAMTRAVLCCVWLVVLQLITMRLRLTSAQAVYPTNLCGFPGPDEEVPLQCFYDNDPTGASGYACCPVKPGCCGSE